MFDSCSAGRGGLMLVSGPAASGKTALLRAFGERVDAAGAMFLQATASAAERDMPLGVMGQLLLDADLPASDAEDMARMLDLAAVTAPMRGTDGMVAAAITGNVFPRLFGILLARFRNKPVVLSIDDVHHADTHSLEFILYLARRLEIGRIMVVLGESSSFLPKDLRFQVELLRLPSCRHIRLGLLTLQGVTSMFAAGTEEQRARSLAPDFHRLTGGSPLLMRALLEDHAAAGRVRSAAPVPGEAFGQAVTTCLYRSDVAVRRTAWALAALGPHASLAELADVLGTAPESAGRSLTALNDMGLLSAGWFRHETGAATVLRSMESRPRAQLEARVAEVLHDRGAPATELARHLIVAEPMDAPWALAVLLEGAERALAADEVELALDCLRVARETSSDEEEILAIRAGFSRASWRVNPAAAARHLPELTAAALSGRTGARDGMALVGHLLWFGRPDQALAVLDAVESGGAKSGGPDSAGPAEEPVGPHTYDLVRRWMAYEYPGLPGAARPDAVDIPAATLSQSAQLRALTLLRAVLAQDAGDDVAIGAEQVLQGSRLDDQTLEAVVAALALLLFADELNQAALWCDALLKEAVRRRAPLWQAVLASAKAFVDIRLGRLVEAEKSAHSALALVPPEGWGVAMALPVAAIVYAKVSIGRLDEAAVQLSIPLPDAAFQTVGGLLYLWARGHYHLGAGRPYAALDDFHMCGDLMDRWDLDLPAIVPWRTDAAHAYLALRDDRRARALAEEQLARVGAGRSWVRGVTLRGLAATVEPGHRPRLLGEAVEILRERGHRLELARAVGDLSRAHQERGDENAARAAGRKAQQLMRECGVEPPGPEIGPRGAPPDVGGGARGDAEPVELSDAQLRVATLAAQGHTNRVIADMLFITVSTVEQHLTRAYRKLDVSRRTELAPKLPPIPRSGLDRASTR